jgi:hypothetical protein
VDDGLHPVRAELRRRTRRWGLVYFASAPLVGILIAVLSRPRYGVFLGAIFLELGLYVRFVYVPFAAWLRLASGPADRSLAATRQQMTLISGMSLERATPPKALCRPPL